MNSYDRNNYSANNSYSYNTKIHKLQVPCTTFTIERAPTPGFELVADQYEGITPFDTILHVSYPAGANQIVRIVNSDPITGDSCLLTDVTLDSLGNANIPYSITKTHVIYVIIKTATDGSDCCTSFSTTSCQYSNYIKFDIPTQILQAGLGEAGMILVGGLIIGAILMSRRKPKQKV